MAIPISYFGYAKLGLQVKFKDLSLQNPITYDWGFGDGNTSVVKDPVHIYTVPGFYLVTLTTTNLDGTSEEFAMNIGVGGLNEIANANIPQLIDDYLPTALVGISSMTKKASLINKWQLYLQPLVYFENPVEGLPPIEVAVEDTHNEYEWPALVNYLIAQLSSYDIILQGANQFLSMAGNTGGTTTTTTDGVSGQIKSIETGPAKTEWYENRSSEELADIGAAFANATKIGGALDKLQESICQLAARVRIYLPMCGQLAHNTTAPQVAGKPCRIKHNANPFGITKRMT